MRGSEERSGALFSYAALELRVRGNHPLRAIKAIVNDALKSLAADFAALYAPIGRPSIPPEKLLRAMLLQAFYSIRSERQLMERLEYDLLFRWFAGLDDRSDARLYKKGKGKQAKLCFMGHGLMENRNGLLVDACLTLADGKSERLATLAMIEHYADRPHRIMLGADKAYDTQDCVNELRSMRVTPHVPQNNNGRRSAIDGRATRHAGYGISLRIRKRIEEAFGWMKTVGGQNKTGFQGLERADWSFTFCAAAYNLVRLPKLLAGAP